MEPSCVHIYRKYFLTEHEVNWMERAENHEWSARGPIKAKFDNAFRRESRLILFFPASL